MDINKASRSQLELYIRSKGKRANQRIVELSKSKYGKASKALSYIERNAFDNSKYYTTSKSGNIKFTVSTRELTKGLTQQQAMASLRHQASEIKNFLDAKSSTIKGIHKQFSKASKTLSENYGIKMNVEEVGEIFKVYDETSLTGKFGSEQIIETYKKYMNDLSVEEMKKVIRETTGVTVNDVDIDMKRQVLLRRYKTLLPTSVIEETLRNNRMATISELSSILDELLDTDVEFYDSWD